MAACSAAAAVSTAAADLLPQHMAGLVEVVEVGRLELSAQGLAEKVEMHLPQSLFTERSSK